MGRSIRVFVVVAVGALLAMSCGGGGDTEASPLAGEDLEPPDGGSVESSPFVVGTVPPEFEFEVAGRGTETQDWGDDTSGTDEPFTVLAPPGEGAGSDEAVIVSVTGTSGYQGGFAQASPGYISDDVETFEVDGLPAIYTPTGTETVPNRELAWADLIVEREDSPVVRVVAADADRDYLVDIARRVEPDGHERAPRVPEPPDGLEVVGSVDAGVVDALDVNVTADTDIVPGFESAHSAGWLAPDDHQRQLSLVAYPGRSADLVAFDALARIKDWTVTPTTVGGRPGVAVEGTVLAYTPWGDVVMAGSYGDPAVPTADLAAMLTSLRQASPAEWEAFTTQTAGGADPYTDEATVDLERGTATGPDGEIGWLLQAAPDGTTQCLQLSTRTRLCFAGSDSDGTWTDTGGEDVSPDSGVPTFVVATIDVPGARLRLTTPAGTAEGLLHQLPNSDRWAGIVFADGLGQHPQPVCDDDEYLSSVETPATLEVLDDAGAVVACIDSLGNSHPR